MTPLPHSAAGPTPDPTADRAFARFCRTGDPEALAEVFDRAAPRLALLAGYLVPRDRHAVEDLVQTTFLEAMRSAPRFEPGRPVLPWMVTILGRRAANLQRTRSRRKEIDGEMAGGNDSLDPARIVADRELAERVAESVEQLGAPYREVMTLRLVHNLSAAEIAQALDRPLGTVHAQLHRGHDRLRRVLPASLAVALGAVLADNGLAAVRARVVEAARKLAPTATAGGVGFLGGLLMSKAATVCVVLAASALVVLALQSPADEPLARPALGTNSESSRMRATDSPAEAGGPPDARREVASAPLEPDAITFIGRVVTAESGQPLVGAEVELEHAPFSRYDGPPVEGTTVLATTESDGRYELRTTQVDDHYPWLRVRAPGRAEMAGTWKPRLRPGAVVDSGEVPMAHGAELSLRVADESGEPVAFYEIQLEPPADGPRSSDGKLTSWGWGGIRRTGLDGVAGPHNVLAGRWGVDSVGGTGHRYSGPEHLTVPAGVHEIRVDMSVHTPDPMRLDLGHLGGRARAAAGGCRDLGAAGPDKRLPRRVLVRRRPLPTDRVPSGVGSGAAGAGRRRLRQQTPRVRNRRAAARRLGGDTKICASWCARYSGARPSFASSLPLTALRSPRFGARRGPPTTATAGRPSQCTAEGSTSDTSATTAMASCASRTSSLATACWR